MVVAKFTRNVFVSASLLVLASCATMPAEQVQPDSPGSAQTTGTGSQSAVTTQQITPYFYREVLDEPAPASTEPETTISKGSGQFVDAEAERSPRRSARGNITLNFKSADLTEFVRVVFEKILRRNYQIDPRINGRVTLHTTYPIRESAILPIVESVLQQSGAAVVLQHGIYRIIPLEDAPGQVEAPRVGNKVTGAGGYRTQVVPLRYASAREIEKVLKPMATKGGNVVVDESRNLLLVTAPRYRLEQMLDTIRIFDVDWMKGMSFGLFRLQYAEATTLVGELESLIGGEGQSPLSGVLRLMPIERLNAVLVISHSPEYIDQASDLINQFDWGIESTPGRRLFVYHLKYSKADKLASVLQQIYQIGDEEAPEPSPLRDSQLPPGERNNFTPPARALYSPVSARPAADDDGEADPEAGEPRARQRDLAPPQRSAGTAAREDQGSDLDEVTDVNIIADPDSNSLLVMARPQDYRGIESVIKQLDIAPRQVLIEANIAEVTLSNSLAYGVRWFLAGGTSELGLNAPVPGAAGGDGLTFATFSTSDEARAFIDLLASKTAVNFLSAPQVMVLDNQTASIRVGDQIPVTVRSSQGTGDGNAPVVSEVQFRDTGTLLAVTPRINAGGQITLEVNQEVSLPGSEPAVGGGGNVAISQRTIDSSVVVQSGETVMLGGLILENKNEARSGIPLLMDIPWLGNLFSSTSDVVFRTELIVMITPRVIESESVMRAIVEEMRGKMKKAFEYGNSIEGVDL